MSNDTRRGHTHVLEVWGDFACFTRPEAKVERYSYAIITPSAARGIFDAIYFKPGYGFYWQIETIELLSLPRYIALRRNEVKNRVPPDRTIHTWMRGTQEPKPIWADGTKDSLGSDQEGRTQRQTMALKNVRYRLHAHMCLRKGGTGDLTEMQAQFKRRAEQGKCFHQPYFGCREFPAWFTQELSDAKPVAMDMDYGWMVYDVFDLSQSNGWDVSPSISLFEAQLRNGRIAVPSYTSPEVRKNVVIAEQDHA